MEDYDPQQEEDNYDSTPEPEAMVEPFEDFSLEDKSRIRRYVILDSEQTSERPRTTVHISGRRSSYFPGVNRDTSHNIHVSLSSFTNQISASEQVGTSHELTYSPYPPAAFPRYLLLLFFPGPLNALPSSRRPCQPTTRSKHTNFLAHLSHYPYLTFHKNYVRHTGYVLD